MYTSVSDEFKKIIKSSAVTAVAKIIFTNPNITIEGKATADVKSSLQDVQITDNCYSEGKLIGTAMTKEVEINIINKDNLDLADKEFELFVGVKLAEGEYEYIPYGKYIVTKYEDTKSNNIFKLIAYDYMNKLNGLFTDLVKEGTFNPTFPITLKRFKEQLFSACNLEYEEQSLANDTFMVNAMPGFEGMSIRTVVAKIAELQGTFAKINRDNKIQFYLKTPTTEKIMATDMNSKLEINKQYGPVNVVSLALRDVEGENVTKPDEESIARNGKTMLTIFDNPFVYTEQLRELAIEDLFQALNGFTYVPTKFNYKARLYMDCGDTFEVEDIQTKNSVTSLVLNQHIKIPATRQSSLENLALTDTEIKNEYITQSKQANTHTELMVDKQNQKIESVISLTDEQNEKINRVVQTVDELNSKISDIADITTFGESMYAKVELDGINESEPIQITVKPTVENISYLYPHSNLYPSENLYLKDRKIRFTNKSLEETDENKYIDYVLPDDLLIAPDGTYDEFYLGYDEQICQVTKRCQYNADGTVSKLEKEEIMALPPNEYPKIELKDGDYIIELLGYTNAYLTVRLMAQNIYTTQFATKSEVKSEISQKADEVNISVDKKLSNYSTTTQMNSAINVKVEEVTTAVSKTYETKDGTDKKIEEAKGEIKVTTDNISLEVGKKVNNEDFNGANIMLAINDDTSSAQINADKISLKRKRN